MAFMRRDVNFGLLILIIAAIILFSGFSVYYQTTFKSVSLDYQNKLNQLGEVTKELSTQKLKLNETYSQRVKIEEDKKTLDARYIDVSDENEQLNNDNSNLRSEVSSTKSQLAEKSAQLDSTKNTLAKTQADLSSANSRISSLKNDLDDVCDAYTTLNAGVEHSDC